MTRNKQTTRNSELLELLHKVEPFEVIATPIATHYIATINDAFEDSRQFEDLVRVLENARQGDFVEIRLTTPGGSLESVLPLLAAMDATQAQVAVHAISDVSSAGTLVLLAADDAYINPYITVMFHQPRFGTAGPSSSVEALVNHTMKSSKALLQDYYKDFFSTEEIDAMLAGKDFYMDKEEFDERYEYRIAIREARMNEAIEETSKSLEKVVKEKPAKKDKKSGK